MGNQIEIFKSDDNQIELKVQFDIDTVWLTQAQMAELFERNRVAVTQHIGNIFKEGELEENLVCKDFLQTTPHGAIKGKTQSRTVKFYNLDVIISVGYRVKSKRGTQFRQWATQRLKDYLVQGYAVNEKRLEQKQQEVQHLKDGIRIVSRAIEDRAADTDFQWLNLYAEGLRLLDDYDHETLDSKGVTKTPVTYPTYENYMAIIEQMRAEVESTIFGQERENGFKSAIAQIRQSIGQNGIYPSFEEKAATLLYLIVKNHAFVDGNKRIAAACFLLFLQRNNRLRPAGEGMAISNEALASLTLFIAVSKSNEMETVKRLIISILNRNK
ncbi:MAG: RhuM family protein [Desulfobacterales bacterium]|jgi:death-on-curing family protein|nr:RhuM family protein [Desulfobacterales bacterium]MDD3081446.1 RhuM family protein [Desulfobacterales bacterium]MDD3950361.1 RhuM family protein [Desulfobacterales bacterium]MDD4463228.1 RhuM family protein [Desulfobacterales bacterium]MDY0377748.1 RhuM family protein [Desulfobacterales bacterium]